MYDSNSSIFKKVRVILMPEDDASQWIRSRSLDVGWKDQWRLIDRQLFDVLQQHDAIISLNAVVLDEHRSVDSISKIKCGW